MMEVLQTSALPLGYGAGDSKPKVGQGVPQSVRESVRIGAARSRARAAAARLSSPA